ncbi:DEAD/DEAH box helicase family protein [Escherichia coli]|uniref:protein DpdE n=1 Tax=Escherichia coli TaxID=562 RepID=UPI0006A5EF88|nr:protein DpdE [Escherichia coli]EKJ3295501.1 DEAD/DEAH box helicase family protein [Escherichia coli]EKQ3321236.1 DEAD/DEAH box helicase family protein [Escherichia coli]EKR5236566.1 DEAD/DEAH box helicase family protein [Escherichia coli]EKS5474241.1 DEAD/DEAH box helicase family protein [Escherichia coli]ELD1719904.1 DEAD/DEAH box helicase family protein [Escherichia coli]
MTTHTGTFSIGDLVTSSLFNGIAKIVSIISAERAEIAWFYSPLEEEVDRQEIDIRALTTATLYEECTVYFRSPESGIWCRGRYGGSRPGNKHLLIIRTGDHAVVDLAEIFYPNYGQDQEMNPAHFLAARSNDAPYFYPLRERFVSAWIKQRAACRSMSSLISSRVEIEPHQIAVVRRILQDQNPKYLLADEVGLGKTIEAGLVIREHILECNRNARVLVVVPQALKGQWNQELIGRFALGEVMMGGGRTRQIRLCNHEEIADPSLLTWNPTLIVVDEAHQLARSAWADDTDNHVLYTALVMLCHQTGIVLLLSGTPMHGNELNFLAMLHCLNKEAWPLDPAGCEHFIQRVAEREALGGIYTALQPENDNGIIENCLDELSANFSDDEELQCLIDEVRPLVDFIADEEGEERSEKILMLRHWLGEHYRLFHRLLRNRREDPSLALLFPGLSGLKIAHWSVKPEDVTLDELLEDWRASVRASPDKYRHITTDNLSGWVDALFTSPLTFSRRARLALEQGSASVDEQNYLEQALAIAKQEQRQKDEQLLLALNAWFANHKQGKAVIFCSEEAESAHLFTKLELQSTWKIVRHAPEKYALNNHWQVLICDRRGEDGLNLHGKERLAVHYSLSRDFNRFEQRLGRFNRYSRSLKGIKPVESLVILPGRQGLSSEWIRLLDQGINLFRQSVASLQFVLDEQIEAMWRRYFEGGLAVISSTIDSLGGEKGFVVVERKKVFEQENLLSMEQEVIASRAFSKALLESEDDAEQRALDMLQWITKALHFNQQMEEDKSGFRLRFERDEFKGRTLVDIQTFIDNCLLGLDFSEGYPPSTAIMTLSRSQASVHKNTYPFRYGQPFVDTVWQLMQSDPRGTTMAILRMMKTIKLPSPQFYFHFQWISMANLVGDNKLVAQRQGDERFTPRLETFWLDANGRDVDEKIIALLERQYDKKGNALYEDMNLRTDVWPQMTRWFDPEAWKTTVLELTEKAKQRQQIRYPSSDELPIRHQLMGVKAIILCSKETFQVE